MFSSHLSHKDTAISQEKSQKEERMAVGLLKAMYQVSWCFLFPEIFSCFLKQVGIHFPSAETFLGNQLCHVLELSNGFPPIQDKY